MVEDDVVNCLDNASPPLGATEETTSGAFRLREDHVGEVGFPVIVINDSPLKSIVENKHGVGESVVDTIVRVTNMSFHKKRVVVYGYGWCGRGIALYAKRRGADCSQTGDQSAERVGREGRERVPVGRVVRVGA